MSEEAELVLVPRAALRDDDLLVGLAMDHHGDAAAYRELRHRQMGRDGDAVDILSQDDVPRLDGGEAAADDGGGHTSLRGLLRGGARDVA